MQILIKNNSQSYNLNLPRAIFLILLFSVYVLVNNACCSESATFGYSSPNDIETTDCDEESEELFGSDFWQKVWGKKSRDALLLGMWSLHLDGTGEYLGNGHNNDQNHLLGIQFYGLSGGTFINSKDDRAWFFGPAREVYSHNFSDAIRFDIGYKFGLLYGYGDDLINVGGMSVFAIGIFGISWKRLGFDLGVVPVGVLTGNFRFDIDF